MTTRVRLRNLTVGTHVHSAFDADDNLILEDFTVQSDEDLQRLDDLNVHSVIVSGSDSSPSEPSAPKSEDEFSLDEDGSFDREVSIKEAEKTYENLQDKMEEVFFEIHEDHTQIEAIDQFKPYLKEFIEYTRESPTCLSFLTQIEDYSEVTFNHSINVSIFGILYGSDEGLDKRDLFEMAFGALLHDIGKTQLPVDLVMKEGDLTPNEYKVIKKHPIEGRNLLKNYGPSILPNIAFEHHERPDGSGYPRGVTDTHSYSKIISVIDVYEALTAPRSYKSALLPAQAFLTMKDEFYDSKETRTIWQNLVECMGLFSIGSFVQLTNGLIGVVEQNHMDDLDHPKVKVILDENQEPLRDPFSVDLHKAQHQKRIKKNYFFDDSVHIEKAFSLDHISSIKPKIQEIIEDRELNIDL